MPYEAPAPYCQPQRPLACAPPDALISVFLCPAPAGHPAARPLEFGGVHPDYFSERILTVRAAVQRRDDVHSYAGVTSVIRRWFSDLKGHHAFLGNATVLTRILSVLHAIGTPGPFSVGDYAFDHSVRVHPRLVPVPGGNLDTLVWLAWRYVHAFAAEGVRLSERLDAESDGLAAATAIFDFITPAGTVPAHNFLRAGDRRVPDADIALWPGPVSVMRTPMRGAVRLLRRGVQRGLVDAEHGRRVRGAHFVYVKPEDDESCQMNYSTYCIAAADVVSAVVTLLRIIGHLVAVARRMVCPLEKRIGLEYGQPGPFDAKQLDKRWAVCTTLLREVLEVNADILDGHFIASAAPTGLAGAFWALSEYESGQWVNENAWLGVAAHWGILPGEPDNIQRAGPRCIPTHSSFLVPAELYPKPPGLFVDYPPRAGPDSLTARLEALVATRRDPGPIPEPPAPGRDHFRWADVWEE